MFAHDHSTPAVMRALDAPPPPLVEGLTKLALEHQLCYEVWPERSLLEGRKIQIGFELQLCGVNSHVAEGDSSNHPVPGCSHCLRTYDELRQIAEWILPKEVRPSRYEIAAFDRAMHIGPHKRKNRNEVVVTIHIMHRHDFNRPVDDCEDRCLKEMRGNLAQLGVREGIWREKDKDHCA